MSTKSKGIYLYGFAQAGRLPLLKVIDIDERYPVLQLHYKDIAAVTSEVIIADFSGPLAETNFKDLAWMGPRAYRHQNVVNAIMRHSPVLPARFGTIFSSTQRMMELIMCRYDTLVGFLEEVDNKTEWALKGFLDRTQTRKALSADILPCEKESVSSLSPGKQYFMKKQMSSDTEKQLNQKLKKILTAIWSDLERYASDSRERKVLSRNSTGLEVDMILNWAYLLDSNSHQSFQECLDRIQTAHTKYGLSFELTGPWPPYSFCPRLEIV